MGLDMYLRRTRSGLTMKTAIEEYARMDDDERLGEKDGEPPYSSCAYWRKSNHVLGWIFKNIKEVENCEDVVMSKAAIAKLAKDCRYAIEHPDEAEGMFPITDGFFFGSKEMGDWYFEDLRLTAEMCDTVLRDTDWDTQEVFFHAWW